MKNFQRPQKHVKETSLFTGRIENQVYESLLPFSFRCQVKLRGQAKGQNGATVAIGDGDPVVALE